MKPFNEHDPVLGVKMKRGDLGLHGDVIVQSEKLPDDFEVWPIVKDSCIAYGEATGHAHKICGNAEDFELRENPTTKVRHLRVVNPVMLKHQEHRGVELPPGEYRTGIQTEYDPFTKMRRQVAD